MTLRRNPLLPSLLAVLLCAPGTDSGAAGICKTTNKLGQVEYSDCDNRAKSSKDQIAVKSSPSNSYAAPSYPPPPTNPNQGTTRPSDSAAQEAQPEEPQATVGKRAARIDYSDEEIAKLQRSGTSSAENRLAQIQQQLDADCEKVRQLHLKQDRAELVRECINSNRPKTPAQCVKYYADYGEGAVVRGLYGTRRRSPLYYDLPECVKAHAVERQNPNNRNG